MTEQAERPYHELAKNLFAAVVGYQMGIKPATVLANYYNDDGTLGDYWYARAEDLLKEAAAIKAEALLAART